MPLFLICGPSGAGKSSLIAAVGGTAGSATHVIRRTTTRLPRAGELAGGLEYEFVRVDTFLRGLADGEFVEHTEHEGALYGIRETDLTKALNSEKASLLMCGTSAAIRVKNAFPDQARLVFVYPGSREDLDVRGLIHDGPVAKEIRRRLHSRVSRDTTSSVANADWIEARVLRGLSRTALIVQQIRLGTEIDVISNLNGGLGAAAADLLTILAESTESGSCGTDAAI